MKKGENSLLTQRRWWSIAISHVLGVFNDNAYKCMALAVLSAGLSSTETQKVSATTSIVLYTPFVLFSFIGGYIGDNFPRHKVIFCTKICELCIMILGFVVLNLYLYQNSEMAKVFIYVILFFMALQSTVFSPTRLGIMPQVFDKSELSHANGSADGAGNIGIILGTFIGSRVLNLTSIIFLLPVISILGCLFSRCIPEVKVETQKKEKQKFNLPSDIKGCLFLEMMFYTLAAGVLTLIFSYIKDGIFVDGVLISQMKATQVQNYLSYMLLLLSLGVGVGCFLAGKCSKGEIKLNLAYIGYSGMLLSLFTLSLTGQYYVALFFIGFLGLSCGFYFVPVRCYLQYFSPTKYRGRILGVSNTLSFIGMSIVNMIIFFLAERFTTREFMFAFGFVLVLTVIYSLYFIPTTKKSS